MDCTEPWNQSQLPLEKNRLEELLANFPRETTVSADFVSKATPSPKKVTISSANNIFFSILMKAKRILRIKKCIL